VNLTFQRNRHPWLLKGRPSVTWGGAKAPTKANEAQCLPTDSGCSRGHLSDLFHALYPCAFPQSLVEPCVPPVQIEDVAGGGISRFFHSCRWDVADSDP
jgi:hypothetical protein